MICTGMCRVAGSSLRLLSTVQPSMSGRKMSSVMAVGQVLAGERRPSLPARGDDAFEALVARQAQQNAGIVRIVLDDQQHQVALLDRRRGRPAMRLLARHRAAPGSAGSMAERRLGDRVATVAEAGPGVAQRQVEREGAALAGDAREPDFAAQQRRQLAADGQAQAGAAVLAAGAGVGLLEGLEDDLLLLRRQCRCPCRRRRRR